MDISWPLSHHIHSIGVSGWRTAEKKLKKGNVMEMGLIVNFMVFSDWKFDADQVLPYFSHAMIFALFAVV